jgi:hypothetical protein
MGQVHGEGASACDGDADQVEGGGVMNIDEFKAEAMRELAGDDDARLGQLWEQIYAVFQRWKVEHGDRQPQSSRGLLTGHQSTPIPFEGAEPWQCADFISPSPVALAIKLWREGYAPFEAITQQEGIRKVLAVLVVGFADSTSEGDLSLAHDILIKHRTAEAAYADSLNRNRVAIDAQKTRSAGGAKRSEQLIAQGVNTLALIEQTAAELAPITPKSQLTKIIAKKVNLPTDSVRKLRKEIKKRQSAS